jgi:hypothetical protein
MTVERCGNTQCYDKVDVALLHESDISQLSSESFNQMIDMISELFIVDPETA